MAHPKFDFAVGPALHMGLLVEGSLAFRQPLAELAQELLPALQEEGASPMEPVVSELPRVAYPPVKLRATRCCWLLLLPGYHCAVLDSALTVEHVAVPVPVVDFDVIEFEYAK